MRAAANGTPIVVGFRQLSIEEFWDMRATDGSSRFPTNAFKRITTARRADRNDQHPQLSEPGMGVSPPDKLATPGQVLVIDGFIELPRWPSADSKIPTGTTIRGDRRGIVLANRRS